MSRIAFQSFAPKLADGETVWTSPWIEPGFAVADVVPSWNATTGAGSWIEVQLQGRRGAKETRWYALGIWSSQPTGARSSVPGQDDGECRVDTDVLVAGTPLDAFRVRVMRRHSGTWLSLVAVVASTGRDAMPRAPSDPVSGRAVELAVPSYSQSIHAGHFPAYDGGGASWCSAASTAMLIGYWGGGPTDAELAWAGEGHVDPAVDHAVRATYDTAYGGCGNWPFNTAYAATFGLEAFVTRLGSVADMECYLTAGIPLAASIAAAPGELDGFLAAGSAGHIVVVRGVTAAGDPIVNDPAAPSNELVRRVYDRAQFERAWLTGSGGVVYVVRSLEVSLPA